MEGWERVIWCTVRPGCLLDSFAKVGNRDGSYIGSGVIVGAKFVLLHSKA